jgi:hypothetical protein
LAPNQGCTGWGGVSVFHNKQQSLKVLPHNLPKESKETTKSLVISTR